MISDSSKGLHGVTQGSKYNILGFVIKGSLSGCVEENENYLYVVDVSFVCLRESFQMVKGGQIGIYFFLNYKEVLSLQDI